MRAAMVEEVRLSNCLVAVGHRSLRLRCLFMSVMLNQGPKDDRGLAISFNHCTSMHLGYTHADFDVSAV